MADGLEVRDKAPEPPEPVRVVRADALRRADQAWRLRVLGAPWSEVAEAAGFSTGQNACRAVREVYGDLPEVEKAEQRALWRERLDWLWQEAARDVEQQRPGAVVAAVRVAQAAARLDGLDAPSEFVVHDPTQTELEQWVATVIERGTPRLEEADIFEDDGQESSGGAVLGG